MSIINLKRSIIPACDLSIEVYEELLQKTADIEKVGAYKVGFELGLLYGLPKIVELTRKYSNKPIIYDHQKSGTDIPDTGKNFARILAKAGIDTVIHFSHAGPATLQAWIEASLEEGLNVIIGGLMTHAQFLTSDGGYIADTAIPEIYKLAAKCGVTDFVVPGNKPQAIKQIRELLINQGINPIFYAPGFIAQGGSISESGQAAGESWHAIVGRGLYQADDMRQAALEYTSLI